MKLGNLKSFKDNHTFVRDIMFVFIFFKSNNQIRTKRFQKKGTIRKNIIGAKTRTRIRDVSEHPETKTNAHFTSECYAVAAASCDHFGTD